MPFDYVHCTECLPIAHSPVAVAPSQHVSRQLRHADLDRVVDQVRGFGRPIMRNGPSANLFGCLKMMFVWKATVFLEVKKVTRPATLMRNACVVLYGLE
jgi:hypothetical protein